MHRQADARGWVSGGRLSQLARSARPSTAGDVRASPDRGRLGGAHSRLYGRGQLVCCGADEVPVASRRASAGASVAYTCALAIMLASSLAPTGVERLSTAFGRYSPARLGGWREARCGQCLEDLESFWFAVGVLDVDRAAGVHEFVEVVVDL